MTNKQGLYTYYIINLNDDIDLIESEPQDYLSKIILKKHIDKNILLNDLNKTVSSYAKSYYNVIELHSIFFKGSRLESKDFFKYIFPKRIEMIETKINIYLESFWNSDKNKKIKEITNKNITLNHIKPKQIENYLIFKIANEIPYNFRTYEYPNNLSILENKIYNHINRNTMKFHFIRKYENNQIIPFLNETNLIGYEDYKETYINDVYEYNIEINLEQLYDQDLFNTFIELNSIKDK